MDFKVKILDIIKNNLTLIVLVIAFIFGYSSLKAFYERVTKNYIMSEKLIEKFEEAIERDSIRSAKDKIIIDSLTNSNKIILKDLKYIKNQNDAIHEKNKKIIDYYNSIDVVLPEL